MTTAERLKAIISKASFKLYQTHTWENEILNEGIRGVQRRLLINPDDIKGKAILDLGCATGAECIWSIENGANLAVGIERDKNNADLFANLIGAFNQRSEKLYVIQHDLKYGLPNFAFDIDTLFCFSITHHLGYKKMWHEVSGVTVVYVEGGADSGYTEETLSDDIFEASLLGYVENHTKDPNKRRPLFRLIRKISD